MGNHPRRRTGWPVVLLAFGLLALLCGATLTLLDGALRQRTGLDAAGLQATLEGVRAAYAQANVGTAQAPQSEPTPADAVAAAQTAFERQLDAFIAQAAPGHETLARWVLQALPYVRWRFMLLCAGSALALAGVLWLALCRARYRRSKETRFHSAEEDRIHPYGLPERSAGGTGRRHTLAVMEATALPAEAPPLSAHCQGCGEPLRANARFCGNCGRPVPH